ncbi:cyclophilin-like fold protein [Ensifer sp. Root127]|uniref:cyclophilin-like fold protein n=1 Tax=Ensifer sp. Root127 TaxID=1736440 RepID=UPI000B2641F4|nr:cyclophilin-like fold protein [Ensifer sp. Root127]
MLLDRLYWSVSNGLSRNEGPSSPIMSHRKQVAGANSRENERMSRFNRQMVALLLAAHSVTLPTMSFAQTKDRNPTSVIGTVVRFTDGATTVDVTVGEDSPAVRDFLSMLPLTLKLEEFAGREKISYLPRKLKHIGSPGSDPEDGDLIYFVPWGNLGFYYNTAGIDYSDQTLHIGTYKASPATLEKLADRPITVEVLP